MILSSVELELVDVLDEEIDDAEELEVSIGALL